MTDYVWVLKRPDGTLEARACGYSERDAWYLQAISAGRTGPGLSKYVTDLMFDGYRVVKARLVEVE